VSANSAENVFLNLMTGKNGMLPIMPHAHAAFFMLPKISLPQSDEEFKNVMQLFKSRELAIRKTRGLECLCCQDCN
jgi:hypothetical protein